MTLSQKLAALANPAIGFMQNIRLLPYAPAQLLFANGWVTAPPPTAQSGLTELPPMPVSGYGTTRDIALNRLMMEAVERNSCTFTGAEPFTAIPSSEFQPHLLRSLSPYSEKQYATRHASPAVPIPAPLPLGSVIRCVAAKSLLQSSKSQWFPAGSVYLGYGAAPDQSFWLADSNGCAAGELLDDAIYRGLLEVIERDALAIWWFNRIPRPALSIQGDDSLLAIEEALLSENRSLTLLDLTHDLAVPVVAALTAGSQGRRIYLGCAAGSTLQEAAFRAACEMLQFFLWGTVGKEPPARAQWLANETLDSQPWLNPKEYHALCDPTPTAINPGLTNLIAKLAAHGMESFYVDLTRPWFQIPVVKVLVPGLRSLLPQFGPGRLYDVPVKLGWLSEPTREEDLLPYACPL